MIAVEEENEYESDEWYFEDPDADYLQRVRYQIVTTRMKYVTLRNHRFRRA